MDQYEINFLLSLGLVFFWPVLLVFAFVMLLALVYVLFLLAVVVRGVAGHWMSARSATALAIGAFLLGAAPFAILAGKAADRFINGSATP